MVNKKELRLQNKKIRHELFLKGRIADISKSIVAKIETSDFFKEAEHIMLFHPKEEEVNLLALAKHKDKTFYLPRINGLELEACKFAPEDELRACKFGVMEPVCEALEELSKLDLIFVPALGVDKFRNRLGYGGGFYDRFLAQKSLRAEKIVVIPKDLIADDEIEHESFDFVCDRVISEG